MSNVPGYTGINNSTPEQKVHATTKTKRIRRKKARSMEDRAKSTPKEEGGGDKTRNVEKFINAPMG
jgi:hypothetical protein